MSSQTDAALRLAEVVRQACISAALEGYEQAAVSGLCHEGALEVAVDAIRMLDLVEVIAEVCRDADNAG